MDSEKIREKAISEKTISITQPLNRYENSEKVGTWVIHDTLGAHNKIKIVNYKAGEKHGKYIVIDNEWGCVSKYGTYKNGKKIGVWHIFALCAYTISEYYTKDGERIVINKAPFSSPPKY